MTVKEMNVGMIYNPADLVGRWKTSACACCGKAVGTHDAVVCIEAPDKGAQGCKTVVGLYSAKHCKPMNVDSTPAHTVTLLFAVADDGKVDVARMLYASRNATYRAVKFLPGTDGRLNGRVAFTIGISDGQGCQQVVKMAAQLGRYCYPVAQSLDGGDWEAVDSRSWTERFGCGIARGRKAYGI